MQPLQLQGLAGLLSQQLGGYGQQPAPAPRFDFEPPDPEDYQAPVLRQANAAAPSGSPRGRGLTGFMERMFSSGSTEGVSEEDRRSSLTNAMLMAGQAIANSDNPITGLGQGLLAGKQVYGQGIAHHLQAAAEERQKQQMRDALRSVHVDPAMADYDPEGAHQLLVAHMAPQAQPKPREPIIQTNAAGQQVLLDPVTMQARAFGGDNPVEAPKPVAPDKPKLVQNTAGQWTVFDPETNSLVTAKGNNPPRPRPEHSGQAASPTAWMNQMVKSKGDVYWVDPPAGPGQMPTTRLMIQQDQTGSQANMANSLFNAYKADQANYGVPREVLQKRAWEEAGKRLQESSEVVGGGGDTPEAAMAADPAVVDDVRGALAAGATDTNLMQNLVRGSGMTPLQAAAAIKKAKGGAQHFLSGDEAQDAETLSRMSQMGDGGMQRLVDSANAATGYRSPDVEDRRGERPLRPSRTSAPLGQGGPAAGMQVGGVQVPQKTVAMPGARGSSAQAGVAQSRAQIDPEEAQDAAELVAEKGEEEARKWLRSQGHSPSEVVRVLAMARGMMGFKDRATPPGYTSADVEDRRGEPLPPRAAQEPPPLSPDLAPRQGPGSSIVRSNRFPNEGHLRVDDAIEQRGGEYGLDERQLMAHQDQRQQAVMQIVQMAPQLQTLPPEQLDAALGQIERLLANGVDPQQIAYQYGATQGFGR